MLSIVRYEKCIHFVVGYRRKQMTGWKVYCLQFGNGEKTYVGATSDFSRRIRQHNDELAGGAMYTTSAVAAQHDKRWKPIFIVHGFPSKRAALQFEWALKHETLRHRTENDLVKRRIAALHSLLRKERVTSNADLLRTWNLSIEMQNI